jgi:hypothetical protein
MHNVKPGSESAATKVSVHVPDEENANELPLWEAPKLEDVSEQVMAQPYIRFT